MSVCSMGIIFHQYFIHIPHLSKLTSTNILKSVSALPCFHSFHVPEVLCMLMPQHFQDHPSKQLINPAADRSLIEAFSLCSRPSNEKKFSRDQCFNTPQSYSASLCSSITLAALGHQTVCQKHCIRNSTFMLWIPPPQGNMDTVMNSTTLQNVWKYDCLA